MVVSCAIPEIFICSWGRWGRINCELGEVGGSLSPLVSQKRSSPAASCFGPESASLKRADLHNYSTSFHTPSPLSDLLLRISTANCGGYPVLSAAVRGDPERREREEGGQGAGEYGRGIRPRARAKRRCWQPPLRAPEALGIGYSASTFLLLIYFFLLPRPSPPLPPSLFLLAEL